MRGSRLKIGFAILIIVFAMSKFITPITTYAKEDNTVIKGDVYQFEEKAPYDFSSSVKSETAKAYGTLSVSGDIIETSDVDGITALSVNKNYDEADDGNLSIAYTYNDDLLDAADDEWHLVDDKTKKVETISLKEKMGKGALILQTSKDGKTWVTAYSETNIFENVSNRKDAFYNTTDVQIVNGCYYRVIVTYKVGKKVDPTKILFVNLDNYEYQKFVEVYTFYAFDETAKESLADSNIKRYSLGSKVRTEKYEGYYGETTITKKDPHYGWELGEFFVSGYTDQRKESDGNIVFLKNVGDQVTLWFHLQQDINCLNGKDTMTVMEDNAGSDQYFETMTTDFGRGALIVRKTNYENVTERPIIYTNYLEAVATIGADTKVNLFEEGDYEVALDYAINYDKTKILGHSVLPEQAHYRIYFKFSVRNSNSMFYPRDIKTGSELTNNAVTTNGFYLDLANSKYLQLNIVKEVLKNGATGLIEDVRKNTSAKDGDSYTEEGIYTITVTNQYTGQSTTKKLYIGENALLKAYMVTGLSISEIQDKIALGATISDDGTIIMPNLEVVQEQETVETQENIPDTGEVEVTENNESTTSMENETKSPESIADEDNSTVRDKTNFLLLFIFGMIALVIGGCFILKKKKKLSNDIRNEEE